MVFHYDNDRFEGYGSQLLRLMRPKNYSINHIISSIDDLLSVADDYGLVLFDEKSKVIKDLRASTGYLRDEEGIKKLLSKSEVISDSPYQEFLCSGCIGPYQITANKAVGFSDYDNHSFLIRYSENDMKILRYNKKDNKMKDFYQETGAKRMTVPKKISHGYKAHDPRVINLVILANQSEKASSNEDSRMLVVADGIFGIVYGNVNGCDVAATKKNYSFI